MKTKLASLLVVALFTTFHCVAQEKITVQAQNEDISDNLDLKAVASVFGDSKNLQDFEMRLNDYDSQISNLDLNGDGEVDYLRVIESSENNVHLVVIQAVLGPDVYQDVATIMVEKNRNNRTIVQVIGDPYLYGNNYIVEPVYVYTPSIFAYFYGNRYRSWYSPYYWGYYPRYYRDRRPYAVNFYMNHIYSHINHDYRYYYTDRRRNGYNDRLYRSISRNDYGTRYPDRTFTRRNQNVVNKQAIDQGRNRSEGRLQTRPDYQSRESERRNVDMNSSGRNQNVNTNRQNSTNRTYTPSTSPANNREGNRDVNSVPANRSVNSNRESYQAPNSNSNNVRRNSNNDSRNNNTRPAQEVNKPRVVAKPNVVERKPAATVRSEQPNTKRESRSADNTESNRR